MSDNPFARGPAPRQGRYTTPPASSAAELEQPTYWVDPGRTLIANPNVCEVCHKAPHSATSHHEFAPDRAPVAWAARLGWPLPPQEELPL